MFAGVIVFAPIMSIGALCCGVGGAGVADYERVGRLGNDKGTGILIEVEAHVVVGEVFRSPVLHDL